MKNRCRAEYNSDWSRPALRPAGESGASNPPACPQAGRGKRSFNPSGLPSGRWGNAPSIPAAWGQAGSIAFESDAKESGYNPRAGDKGSAQRSGDLGFAARPTTMIDRNFQNAQRGPRRAHLHFEVPSVGRLFHSQDLESVAPDGTKGAHIGIRNRIEQPQQPSGDAAGNDLLEVHAAALALPARAGPDDEILFAPPDWVDKLKHEFRAIAAIAIEKDNDVAIR